jgi:hypothetical protein
LQRYPNDRVAGFESLGRRQMNSRSSNPFDGALPAKSVTHSLINLFCILSWSGQFPSVSK